MRYQYYKLKRYTHKIDISNLQPLSETGDEWFAKYHVIAHNGGIIQGRTKSDSLEAWELSYSRGVRIIDADLNFTSDNHLVLRHDWNDDLEQDFSRIPPSFEEFMSTKIFMKYTPMSIEDMIDFMKAHEDLYVAVDCKEEPAKVYSSLVNAASSMNASEILERIIVSLYKTEDVAKVKSVYPFRNFALRQYGWQHNWYDLAEFCVKNSIHVVNVWDFVADTDPEGIKILLDKNIHVWAAPINSLRQMQRYKDLGITGAVSDYLSESDWELLK